MCWKCLGLANPQRALVDKRVFKIVRKINSKEFASYFQDHTYQLNVKCPLIDIQVYTILPEQYITEGYHSYNINLDYVENKELQTLKILGVTGVLECYSLMRDICGLECIIPKGTLFYENERGEIVSETIIPLSIFNVKKTNKFKKDLFNMKWWINYVLDRL